MRLLLLCGSDYTEMILSKAQSNDDSVSLEPSASVASEYTIFRSSQLIESHKFALSDSNQSLIVRQ